MIEIIPIMIIDDTASGSIAKTFVPIIILISALTTTIA
jgi:hypothetical protein